MPSHTARRVLIIKMPRGSVVGGDDESQRVSCDAKASPFEKAQIEWNVNIFFVSSHRRFQMLRFRWIIFSKAWNESKSCGGDRWAIDVIAIAIKIISLEWAYRQQLEILIFSFSGIDWCVRPRTPKNFVLARNGLKTASSVLTLLLFLVHIKLLDSTIETMEMLSKGDFTHRDFVYLFIY